MATTLVKIKFDEDLRMVEIPSQPCFSEFVKTVAEAYDLALGEAQSLTFNYKDTDGDEVRTHIFGPGQSPSCLSRSIIFCAYDLYE